MTTNLTIAEIKDKLARSVRDKLMKCEKSDINQQIVRDREIGFEAVLTGNGDEKTLLPEDHPFVFLYRGQNREFAPCLPSLFRPNPQLPSEAEKFLWRMRLILFHLLLDSYPIVEHFFKRHNFKIDYEGLAQHYGLLTSTLDLTSNLDIALFFATCWYDREEDCYRPFDDGMEHTGILYVFCPMRANEPTPCKVSQYLNENITPIGLQPFLRPAVQKGYALHMAEGRSTKSWAYRFQFTCEDSRYFYDMFDEGRALWIYDIMAEKSKLLTRITQFSHAVFKETWHRFRPKGISRSKLFKELDKMGISFSKCAEEIVFTQEEAADIIRRWNAGEGADFCNRICRRPWYERIGDESIEGDGEINVKVGEMHPYRTLSMLGNVATLSLIASPEGPEGAEWVNYYNRPNESRRWFTKAEQQWHKCGGELTCLFGKRYLTESDWKINNL